MPNFTEQAIKASFLMLLNEKPLNQITVKDVVEKCGINRNSFYYHFADLPTLLEELIMDQANEIINSYPTFDSLEQCMSTMINYALENKKAVYHIFNSVNRGMYEQSLMHICKSIVAKYIDTAFADKAISDEDKEIFTTFYACECFGQIVNWIMSGMKADILQHTHRICELRKGLVEQTIERSALK